MPTKLQKGFTLVELLVVISIMAIMSVFTFINVKDFTTEQALNKAVGDIQSLMRLAQSNATSSTLCGSSGGVTWTVRFNSDQSTLDIICGSNNTLYRTLTLQNVLIASIKTSSCISSLSLPVSFTYSALKGVPDVTDSSGGISSTCLGTTQSVTVNLLNAKSNSTKSFNISKGGAINVQ